MKKPWSTAACQVAVPIWASVTVKYAVPLR